MHLAFNMYVLYLYGAIVERMYGPIEYIADLPALPAGGSVLTILVDPLQFGGGRLGRDLRARRPALRRLAASPRRARP